jgi:hypothetical protein
MRQASSNKSCIASASQPRKSEAKSLFRKILPASLFASIFYPDHPLSKTSKSFRSMILAEDPKKNVDAAHPGCRIAGVSFRQSSVPLRKPDAESRTPDRGVKYQSNP